MKKIHIDGHIIKGSMAAIKGAPTSTGQSVLTTKRDQHDVVFLPICGQLKLNKLASLEATLVRNYDPLNHLITDGGKV